MVEIDFSPATLLLKSYLSTVMSFLEFNKIKKDTCILHNELRSFLFIEKNVQNPVNRAESRQQNWMYVDRVACTSNLYVPDNASAGSFFMVISNVLRRVMQFALWFTFILSLFFTWLSSLSFPPIKCNNLTHTRVIKK